MLNQVPTDVPVHRGSVGAMSLAAGREPMPVRFYVWRGVERPEPETEPEPKKPKPKKRAKPKKRKKVYVDPRRRPDGTMYPWRVYAPATYDLHWPKPRAAPGWVPPTLADYEDLLDD